MSAILVLAAVILFVLRAVGVGDGDPIDLGWLGLALYAASVLVGAAFPYVRRPGAGQ